MAWTPGGTPATHQEVQDVVARKRAEVFDVKDYGATGNGTTDDGPAISAAILAASTAGSGYTYRIVLIPPGQYRVATSIIAHDNVLVSGYGAELNGPITGAAVINSGNQPATAGATDVAAQTAGGCFTDDQPLTEGYVWSFAVEGLTITGFRYGVVTRCTAWPHPTLRDIQFQNCNIGFFAYQGCQEPRLWECASVGGAPGTTFVGAATCFASGNPQTGQDNYFCDGFNYRNTGFVRDKSSANPAFDTWFSNSILRPTTGSVTVSGTRTFPFSGNNLKPSGRNIYIPSRNGRQIFAPTIDRAESEGCPLGVALIGNPMDMRLSQLQGELMFAGGVEAMVNIPTWGTAPVCGSIESINTDYVTNPGDAVTFTLATGAGGDAGGFVTIRDVVGKVNNQAGHVSFRCGSGVGGGVFLDGLYLRNNAGVLEKSTTGTSGWTAIG